MMKNTYKYMAVMLMLMMSVQALRAQDWNISAEQKAQKLPIAFDEANQDAGQAIFEAQCKMCHSELKIVPKNQRQLPLAPNLGCQLIQSGSTDGELFWKITNGKGGMPPFGRLSEDERWKLVAFLRTFYPDYEAPDMGAVPAGPVAEKFVGTIKSMELILDQDNEMLIAKLKAVDEAGNPAIAKNVKVKIYLKRYFGDLLLGKVKTDDQGMAKVKCEATIPADTLGQVSFYAQTDDGAVNAQLDATYGEKLVWENPLDKPHMWGTSAMAPLWLKISYISVVLGVWLVIGWAVFQLFRIYNLRER